MAKKAAPRRWFPRWLPGMLFSALALWLVLRQITWQELISAFRAIAPPILGFAILLHCVALLFRVFCWFILLRRQVRFWRGFFVMNEGYLLNNIFPLRVGEVGRAVLLGKDSGLGFFQVFSTIVVERIYDLAIASGLLLSTLPLALNMEWAKPVAIGVFIAVATGMVALFYLARYRQRVTAWLSKLFRNWRFYQNWVLSKVKSILEGLAVLTDPRLFLMSLAAMLISWALAIFRDFFILSSFVPAAKIWWVAMGLSAGALGAGLPSVAGALGVYEATIVGTLAILGVAQAPALAYAIIVHATQFVISSSLGLVGLLREGENITSLYRSLVSRK